MPLLAPKTSLIAPVPPVPPPSDRASAGLAGGTAEPLAAGLRQVLGDTGVLGRPTDLIRYASDASPYRRIQAAVVQPRTIEEVAGLMAFAVA